MRKGFLNLNAVSFPTIKKKRRTKKIASHGIGEHTMKLLLPLCAAATSLGAIMPGAAFAAGPDHSAHTEDSDTIKWLFQTRTRYQSTEKHGYEDADALTHRTQFGFDAPLSDSGFNLLAEWEHNINLSGDHSTSEDPLYGYATINDPDISELNRLNLSYKGDGPFSFKLGRQYLGFDNKRFIASANWRQDRISHDAARIDYKADNLTASYVYHWQINRPAGTNNDWVSNSHLLNARYALSDAAKVGGFAYFIDIEDPSGRDRSNMTLGGTIKVGHKVNDDLKLYFDGMFAHQTDYGSSSLDFGLNLFSTTLTAKVDGFKAHIGYDFIEGDGTTSLQTPFSAAKLFSGWTNAINSGGRAAPANGLESFNIGASFSHEFEDGGFVEGLKLLVNHHDFESENTDQDLGSEWDVAVKLDLDHNLTLTLGHADYDNGGNYGAPKDTNKQWASLSFRF
jgi:hypothetical protein